MHVADLVRERGPVTVAAFMDLALYHPEAGYYARAARRSGRAGDFFTSVDVGALFGQLLELQIAEMADLVAAPPAAIDLVEVGAGSGRLAADVLLAARERHPHLYDRLRLHLVEASAAARAAQAATLGAHGDRLASSSAGLPARFDGVLIANELLDAFPVHQVVMREDGLREIYVEAGGHGSAARLLAREGPPSTPALQDYLDRLGVTLEPGWRAEINLRAVEWIREVSERLGRGFVILIDYGHEARELYSASHSGGTLTTFTRHTMHGADAAASGWLDHAGEQDLTAHVDFTTIRQTAEATGLTTVGFLDQTYFLLGLLGAPPVSGGRGELDRAFSLKERLALKTLLMPGGLGSTMKVLILGRQVGTPTLSGCGYRMRAT